MLEQAKEDLEQALKEFGGNLTEEEKAELEEELTRIEGALAALERVEDTGAAIEALPDTVEPDKPAGPEEDDGDEGVVAQTGDSADITPWIALILVSVMSMTAAVIIRRKRG